MRAADHLATWILGAVLLTFAMRSHGQQSSDEELATKLSNPVASLIGAPPGWRFRAIATLLSADSAPVRSP
jgi:hypothetical protein